jgi:hypothetical protein
MTTLYLPEQVTDRQYAELLASSSQPLATPQSTPKSESPLQADGSFWLGSLQHPLYRLRRAICLELSAEGGQAIITWPAANDIFGYGPSLTEAIEDFRAALVDLYETTRDAAGLADSLEALRALLDANIVPKTR